MIGGAELTPSAEARTVTRVDGLRITEGPYAECVEQLSGFYVVESSTSTTWRSASGSSPTPSRSRAA